MRPRNAENENEVERLGIGKDSKNSTKFVEPSGVGTRDVGPCEGSPPVTNHGWGPSPPPPTVSRVSTIVGILAGQKLWSKKIRKGLRLVVRVESRNVPDTFSKIIK